MKDRKQKAVGVFLTAALLSGILSGCGTGEGAGFDKGAETQIMPGLTEDQPQHFTIKDEQLGKIGEPVGALDVQNGEVVADALFYTVNQVQIFDDTQAAGLAPEQLLDSEITEDILDETGKLKESVKLLMIDLTVENVQAEPEQNISSLNILCRSGEAEFYELYPTGPVYFSAPSGTRAEDGGWKDYYKYRLPVGREKNVKVCWYVDTAKYDPQNLYLTFGSDELQKYIKLVF